MTIEVPPSAASGRELLEALPVAAVLLAPEAGDLRVVYANPAARQEAGVPLLGALVGDKLPQLREAGASVLRTGTPFVAEAFELGDRGFALHAGKPGDGLLATFSDIPERALAQAQLARREALL